MGSLSFNKKFYMDQKTKEEKIDRLKKVKREEKEFRRKTKMKTKRTSRKK